MTDPALQPLIDAALKEISRRLEEAFVAGGEKVRRELLAVLSSGPDSGGAEQHTRSAETAAVRAPPGTVKPTLEKMIEDAKDGITAADIIKITGFKENSVRGTISTLRSEGKIFQSGDRWFKARKEDTEGGGLYG